MAKSSFTFAVSRSCIRSATNSVPTLCSSLLHGRLGRYAKTYSIGPKRTNRHKSMLDMLLPALKSRLLRCLIWLVYQSRVRIRSRAQTRTDGEEISR